MFRVFFVMGQSKWLLANQRKKKKNFALYKNENEGTTWSVGHILMNPKPLQSSKKMKIS
jgi:hypothetical protein